MAYQLACTVLALSLNIGYMDSNVTDCGILGDVDQMGTSLDLNCVDINETTIVTISPLPINETFTQSVGNDTSDSGSSGPAVPGRSSSLINQGHLSKQQYDAAEVVARYLVYPLIVSGVTVNIINIIVYSDPGMRSSTSTILRALSFNELVFACFSVFRPAFRDVYGSSAVTQALYLYFAMYVSNVFLIAIRRLMYCFTVLVSAERFIAVAFPLKARHFRLVRNPMVFIVAVTLVCLLCHIPMAFKYDVIQKPNSDDFTIKPSNFYLNYKEFIATFGLANKVFYAYLVLLMGLMMNLLVLLAIKMHSKNRQKMQTTMNEEKAAKRERQTTRAILASTFLFTMMALPQATESVVSMFLPAYNLYNKEHFINLLMKEVNALLVVFSLSTDFIFYVILSKAYRRTLCRKLPFLAKVFKREKYLQDATRDTETKMSALSATETKMSSVYATEMTTSGN